ncbi:hypothetical protein [Sphingomonas sp. PP-CE-3G-477]|uniref:hypothetical protein n=1 Tax=Sphingomonas sp. PP-CE-3G-477 TaxID=2135660 RepID=UPI0015E78FE0|nr:hypothetical protein [Sphingomonas sp. PP-CE-3G-477]
MPETEPTALLADERYDADAIREDLRHRGIDAVIPRRSNREKPIIHNRTLYRERSALRGDIAKRFRLTET